MQARMQTHPTLDTVALLESIACVAVEHEGSLDPTRLAGLIDLYAHHVKEAIDGPSCSFEEFVRSAPLLGRAATAASIESGVPTRAPAPLTAGAAVAARRPRVADPAPAGPERPLPGTPSARPVIG